ncbi:MAG: S-adenosylmethionine:tRNA ribosyltransferase-isomerase, partial [Desulfovibrio sp.]|nr:S-adenosylmethionine:tRNA ribosyltransferase-isomerase [Desulfovibrio sp.]
MADADSSDYFLQSYDFPLPERLIAQHPPPERGASRLMVLDRRTGATRTGMFGDILRFLPSDCLLVANNSRVIPARVAARRSNGGKAEVLLLTPPPLLHPADGGPLFPGRQQAEAEALLKPAKKMRPGDILSLADDLAVELLARGPYGR